MAVAQRARAVCGCALQGEIIACGVLSGTKNFEGRLCDCVRANYLASPPLVVAYAIAGTVRIDFDSEPLGEWESSAALGGVFYCLWRALQPLGGV